jgi:queuine tRNA-ribosyltransferase
MHRDLREQSANDLRTLGFDGYALGGLSVGEEKGLMYEVMGYCAPFLPFDKPRYVMEIGAPEDLIEGINSGFDMFDCVIPTRHARNGNLFTKTGRINIKHAKYAADERPIDETCLCYTCMHFSRAYLRHLLMARELAAYYLNTLHNLFFYTELLSRIRAAIGGGRFEEFYKDFMSQWKGGELYDGSGIRDG